MKHLSKDLEEIIVLRLSFEHQFQNCGRDMSEVVKEGHSASKPRN